MAQEITQIMAAFWPPGIYSSLTRIIAKFWPPGIYFSPTRKMAPPQAIPILCQIEAKLFKSPTYAFLAVANLAKDHRPDFNNGPGDYSNNGRTLTPWRLFESDSNNSRILPPSGVYFSPTRIMAPPQAIPILCQMEAKLFTSYLCFPGCCRSGQGPQA